MKFKNAKQRKAVMMKLKSNYGSIQRVRSGDDLNYFGLKVPRGSGEAVYKHYVPSRQAVILVGMRKDKDGGYSVYESRGEPRGWVRQATILSRLNKPLAKKILVKKIDNIRGV